MLRGVIIVAVTLAIGAAVTVTQWDNFFSQPPPVARLTPAPTPPPEPTVGITQIAMLAGSAVQGNPDYDPDPANVPLGNRVVWINQDNVPHTATSGTGPQDPASGQAFDTDIVNGGDSSEEIEIPGDVGDTIPYYCILHPYMTSQVTIVEPEENGAPADGPTITSPAGALIQGNPAYEPDTLTVQAGETVTYINADNAPHTITSGTGPQDPASGQAFDTSIVNAGASATIDTSGLEPGTYAYYCLVHPYMVGELQVE